MTCKHGFLWCLGANDRNNNFRPCVACVNDMREEIDRLLLLIQNIHENTADSEKLSPDQAKWKLGIVHDKTSFAAVDREEKARP